MLLYFRGSWHPDGDVFLTKCVTSPLLPYPACCSGPPICTNLCGLVLFCLLHTVGPGPSSEPHCWWKWKGMCAGCSRLVKEMQGIYCGNFCISQNSLPPCCNAWHLACYTYHGEIKFPMPGIVDEEGNPWHNKDAQQRQMMEGVEGSHLCIPFQYELCWYWNLEGRNPTPGRDNVYLMCIRQANFNAMLGKSSLTIRAHRSQTLASLQNAMRIDKTLAYHPRGPFPVGNPVGMSLAVDMLLKSLVAKGRILNHVQFAMLQKMRSTCTKNWESSPTRVKEGAAFANGKYQVRQTTCRVQSEWFYDFL